jgi:nucleoside phosphorylase
MDVWRNARWRDRGGAAEAVASQLDLGRSPAEAARAVPHEFLAQNATSLAAVRRALELANPVHDVRRRTATALVLTALAVEHAAVVQHLHDVETVPSKIGTQYSVGRFEGQHIAWTICVGEILAGNVGATAEATLAIQEFNASVVAFVGVAGAVKSDLKIGTVVVPNRVYMFQGGRADEDAFRARPEVYPTSHRIVQHAIALRRTVTVATKIKPIAAGDVLVGSIRSEVAKIISDHYNDAIAVDMESGGVYLAAFRLEVPAFAVRGISDHFDDKTAEDDVDNQPLAAANAAEFALALLDRLDVVDIAQK